MSKNWHPDKPGALMAAPDRDVHDYQKHVELMLDLIVLAFQTDQTRIASFMFANSLLDNSMILFGSGMSDGNRHNPADLPILVGGRGGGAFAPGRHVASPDGTPLCNLYVSMLDAMGVNVPRFGDSTGKLKGIDV